MGLDGWKSDSGKESEAQMHKKTHKLAKVDFAGLKLYNVLASSVRTCVKFW